MAFCTDIPTDFGNVELIRNSNLKLFGKHNSGTLSRNSNIQLTSFNSKLNVSGNSNAKINIEESEIETTRSSNLSLSGKKTVAVLERNSNVKLDGENSEWKFSSNSNLNVKGNSCKLNANRISNGIISGDGNNISAEYCSNLNITGAGNNVNIKGISNHYLKPSSVDNVVEIIPGSRSWLSLLTPFYTASTDQFKIDYVDKAVIDKEKYTIGIFDFKLIPRSYNEYDLDFDVSVLDPGSLNSQRVSVSEIMLSAVKDGVQQKIKLRAPGINGSEQGNVFRVDMTENARF